MTPADREALDALIRGTLAGLGLEYERTDVGAYLVPLRGEHKLTTMCWLVVEEHSLLVEAFFMRKPEENEGGTYRFLLERNARTYGVHFSVDALGDVFLTGRTPLLAVTADELDRLLGCVLAYADGNFDAAVRLGFAGAIEKERAWREKLAREEAGRRAEPTAPVEPAGS